MSLETSFTDNISLSHPTTMLTYETECPSATVTSRHRQSVDGFTVVKPTEFQGKLLESPTGQRTSSVAGINQNVMPAARPSMVGSMFVACHGVCCGDSE